MRKDFWIDQLVNLRQRHLAEKTALHAAEINYRLELSKQFKNEMLLHISALQLSKLICNQTQRIIRLNQDRIIRFEALEKRQAEDLWRLFRSKSEPILFNGTRKRIL